MATGRCGCEAVGGLADSAVCALVLDQPVAAPVEGPVPEVASEPLQLGELSDAAGHRVEQGVATGAVPCALVAVDPGSQDAWRGESEQAPGPDERCQQSDRRDRTERPDEDRADPPGRRRPRRASVSEEQLQRGVARARAAPPPLRETGQRRVVSRHLDGQAMDLVALLAQAETELGLLACDQAVREAADPLEGL